MRHDTRQHSAFRKARSCSRGPFPRWSRFRRPAILLSLAVASAFRNGGEGAVFARVFWWAVGDSNSSDMAIPRVQFSRRRALLTELAQIHREVVFHDIPAIGFALTTIALNPKTTIVSD
jgi:hypothetical protein